MNLDSHEYLRGKIEKHLGADEDLLAFFFDAVPTFLSGEEFPEFPAITISNKRDLVFVLSHLDAAIRDLDMPVDWEPSIEPSIINWREYPNLSEVARGAFAELGHPGIKGLFSFYVLSVIFYGGIYMYAPGNFIDNTFPFDVFESLKPYVIAKKLSQEFSEDDVQLAQKSVNKDIREIDSKGLPPYASYVKFDDKYYLVYDVLKGIS